MRSRGLILLAGCCAVGGGLPATAADDPRIRLIIETDAGGDPDDEQSLVRFLVYANEWDVEAIIANRPVARETENLNRERTGLGIVRRLVEAYGVCWPMLVQHDARYPTPDRLLERTVSGLDDSDAGVNAIIRAVDSTDPRPVWFSNWGTDNGAAPSCLKRALDRVLRDRGEAGYAKFKSRLRLASDDQFGEHSRRDPPWPLWVDTWHPELDRRRWYHRFSALTATAGGFDIERDVRTGHGPLGALYPTNTTHPQKEGDTMSFLYLVPTGLGDQEHPEWGSWAGRYSLREDFPGKPYFWAKAGDTWEGTTHRENSLRRWAVALQNDFRARLDWCVKPFKEANHPPEVALNDSGGRSVVRLKPRAGETVRLDARSSRDPDGQPLRVEWLVYREAGTYAGDVRLSDASSPVVDVKVPHDAAEKQIHVVVIATDSGEPPLTRYRRAVLDCVADGEAK